jgi:hypothetical protein
MITICLKTSWTSLCTPPERYKCTQAKRVRLPDYKAVLFRAQQLFHWYTAQPAGLSCYNKRIQRLITARHAAAAPLAMLART